MKSKILNTIRALFLSGLLTLLPIALTVYLFKFVLQLLYRWFEPLQQFKWGFLQHIPLAEFLLVIGFIFLIGLISKFFIFRPILHWIESLLKKIPLVSPVYSGIKQLVSALTCGDKLCIQEVVYIEFPRPGIYALGFITGILPKEIAPNNHELYYSIFIPTTPTPTTGYLIVVTDKEFKRVSLSRQEAMAMIISGGIVQPDRTQTLSQ